MIFFKNRTPLYTGFVYTGFIEGCTVKVVKILSLVTAKNFGRFPSRQVYIYIMHIFQKDFKNSLCSIMTGVIILLGALFYLFGCNNNFYKNPVKSKRKQAKRV